MKKYIFASLVLICSVMLTIKSNNYMNSLSISFLSNNIEALTEGDYDMDGGQLPETIIGCGQISGACWTPEIAGYSIALNEILWSCEYTGYTYDNCELS